MDFLFNAGTSFSGTTPFYYTCIKSNPYCHTGHQKETGYLVMMHKIPRSLYQYHALKITYMDHNHFWQRGVPGRDLIDLGEAHALFDEPYTIEKYIQYYKNVAKRAEGRFHAVGDFTNHNWYLPESFLLELRQEMKKHFDNIRVTCQLRDPIRRYFSRVGKRTSHYTEGQHQFDPDGSHIKNFQEVLMNGKNSRHGTMPRSDDMNRLTLKHNDWKMAHYVQGIQKFERVFGKENVYPIIMEEFWDESRKEEQCKKLSDFLQYPITKIHQNVYCLLYTSPSPRD